jgi:nucleoside-diphosphate-sugar epimerase
MISGEKILVTGVTGSVAGPLARFLADENEVWGAARFVEGVPASSSVQRTTRADLEEAGITATYLDLQSGNFDGVPDDFTYVLHLGWMRGDASQLDEVLRVNAEGTGFLMQHCRKAKAILVMSSTAIYSAHDDPWHAYTEDDPLGQNMSSVDGPAKQTALTSAAAKLGTESVARFAARAFDVPTVITRMNTFAGVPKSLPGMTIAKVLAGQPNFVRWDPALHTPIDVEDIKGQLEAMLDAASTPALITNWCGDEVVSTQQWVADAAAWSGQEGKVVLMPAPGTPPGNISDPTRRRSITGPCKTSPEESFKRVYEAMTTAG